MKANELRLGNWLLNPVQNCAVPMDSRIFYDIISREKAKIDIGWEPVKLDENWLNGFSFKYSKESGLYSKSCFDLEVLNNGVDFYLGEYGSMFTNIEFVHELQNLYFSLNGYELKLKKQ